jgi:hypothetical protein
MARDPVLVPQLGIDLAQCTNSSSTLIIEAGPEVSHTFIVLGQELQRSREKTVLIGRCHVQVSVDQSTMSSPGTAAKSLSFVTTTVFPRLIAMAAT